MSADEQVTREVAYRVFAAEYEEATYSYRESDEERAPNYVVTPAGARVNRLFVVGVLTAVERVGEDDVLRARVADPTGAFVVYAGQYQPEAVATLEDAETPSFVAVTGKANTFTPEGSDRTFTSIRPESVALVDADTRDRWIVRTAAETLERIATMSRALDSEQRGENLSRLLLDTGVPEYVANGTAQALEKYGTGRAYLGALRELALDTLRQVMGEVSEVSSLTVDPETPGETEAEIQRGSGSAMVPGWTIEGELDDQDTHSTEAHEPQSTHSGQSTTDSTAVTERAESPAQHEPSSSTAQEPSDSVQAGDPSSTNTEDNEADPSAASAEDVDEDDFYELDEAEREAVESEYGVEFASGDDIPDAGDAEIEPEAAEPAEESTGDSAPSKDAVEGEDSQPTVDDSTESAEAASAEGDPANSLEDVVIEQMTTMGNGNGVDRDALIEAIVSDRDVDAEAVESAIQDALMSGRCYESGENELTPI